MESIKARSLDLIHLSKDSIRTDEHEKFLLLLSTIKGHEEFLLDKDGIIISTNLEITNITGYEEFEVLGKHISFLYPDGEREEAAKSLKESASRKLVIVNRIVRKKSGAFFWGKIRISHKSTLNPKISYRITLQDTTHKEISNIRLQSFRDQFLTLFDNPFVGTFKYRKNDNRLVMCNKKGIEILGNDQIQFFDDIFCYRSQWEEFTSILVSEGVVEGFEFVIRDKVSLEDNWVLISARNSNPDDSFVWGTLMDISERYNHVGQLKRVNQELENFVYHASHDLRAPLSTILGLTNLGEFETQDPAAKSYFKMVRERVMHLDNLLRDLASISYNQSEDVSLELFSFEEEINSILNQFEPLSKATNVSLSIVQVDKFHCDTLRLRTILRNIISNSLKYSNLENRNAKILIKVLVWPSHASIKLQDNGIGMDLEFKSRVFEMFCRGTEYSKGAGLGLYVVKSMLDKLNGKISLESSKTIGTTILLVIPNGKNGLKATYN